MDVHFALALIFLAVFFITFYLTFLAYKLLQKEKFEADDIVLLLLNSFIFFGVGYATLINHKTGEHLLGLFTLCNAILHFIVSVVIYRQKLANRNIFFLVLGLVLIFITIAIPVQLNGNWVTLLWAGEAALLFWIGRTKSVPFYEQLSYPLMLLAFLSILHDWTTVYDVYNLENPESKITPLLNINFLTSVLFIAAFGFINLLYHNKKYALQVTTEDGISKIMSLLIPAILLFTLYFTFRMEIANYWDQLYTDSAIYLNPKSESYPYYHHNHDLTKFKTIWIINYSLLFLTALAFINFKKLNNANLGMFNAVLITVTIVVFLTQGLYVLSELRDSYLEQKLSEYYKIGNFNLVIRYVCFVFVALALYACYKYQKQKFMLNQYPVVFDIFLYTTVLWILSSELLHWMHIGQSKQSYKLGLSIFWGIYALFLVAIGLWKKKKHLRIAAIALFGTTLLKLFFYDIAHLNTIAKTIVFVSLGVLLLIISFLYNKYKNIITNE